MPPIGVGSFAASLQTNSLPPGKWEHAVSTHNDNAATNTFNRI
jgi:hypothetical protein